VLSSSGDIVDGSVFNLESTLNLTDPSNPMSFNFPDFCTTLGEQVLGGVGDPGDIAIGGVGGGCQSVGDIQFQLASNGDWSIVGSMPSDIGISGSFAPSPVPLPAAVYLFASGIVGLVGFARRRSV
jgi:hypothetical protein